MTKRPQRLGDDEIRNRLGALPGWEVAGGRLRRTFVFETFADAFSFMTALAFVAEKLDHHPEWSNVYNRVVIELATHDAGGITALDFDWAAAANRAFDRAR